MRAGPSTSSGFMSVMMIPGSASAQRTPLGPSSEERPSVSSRTKPFVAPYVARFGAPWMEAEEAVLNSSEPGVLFSKGRAA